MDTFSTHGSDLLPLRVVLWNAVRRLTGADVPVVDRLPTHEPTSEGLYLGYDISGDINVLSGRPSRHMDWSRGWIYMGNGSSILDIAKEIVKNYLVCLGMSKNEQLFMSLIYRADYYPGVVLVDENLDAVICADFDDCITVAYMRDGELTTETGWIIDSEYITGIQLDLYKR